MGQNPDNRYNLYNFEAIFREYLTQDNVSTLTLKNYLSDLRHFLGWISFHLHSKENMQTQSFASYADMAALINAQVVVEYKSYLETNALPPKTINRRLSTLRKFCSLCVKQGWLQENPAKQVSNIVIGNEALEQSNIAVNLAVDEAPQQAVLSIGEIKEDVAATIKSPSPSTQEMLSRYQTHLEGTTGDKKEISLIMEDIGEFLTIINC